MSFLEKFKNDFNATFTIKSFTKATNAIGEEVKTFATYKEGELWILKLNKTQINQSEVQGGAGLEYTRSTHKIRISKDNSVSKWYLLQDQYSTSFNVKYVHKARGFDWTFDHLLLFCDIISENE